jgi:hypothetical protein
MIGTFNIQSQEMSCEELLRYRNTKILTNYIKQKNRYRISEQHINYIVKIKQSLINDTSYATSGYATIAMTVKTVNDVIDNTLSLITIKNIPKNYKRILDAIKFGKKAFDQLNTDKIDEISVKIIREHLSSILWKFSDLKDNLNNFRQQRLLKKDLIVAFNNIEKELKIYNKRLSDKSHSLSELQDYLSYIDNYLKNNCGDIVQNNPIDLESTLWNTQNNSQINLSEFDYNMTSFMNNPEFTNLYDFSNPNFLKDLNNLLQNIDYNSEESMNNYMQNLEKLLQKHIKNPNNNSKNKSQSVDVKRLNKSKSKKRARVVNTSSYSDFKKQRNNSGNSSKPYSKARVKTNSSNSIRKRNNTYKDDCPKCTVTPQ